MVAFWLSRMVESTCVVSLASPMFVDVPEPVYTQPYLPILAHHCAHVEVRAQLGQSSLSYRVGRPGYQLTLLDLAESAKLVSHLTCLSLAFSIKV